MSELINWEKSYSDTLTPEDWSKPVLGLKPKTALELGAYSASTTRRLIQQGCKAEANDVSPMICKELKKHCKVHCFDVLGKWSSIGKYDVIHSSGLLEHFTDAEIVKMLKEAKKHAPVVISMVPNNKSKGYWDWRNRLTAEGNWPYGNEQAKDTLVPLYKKAGFKEIKEYYTGNDFGDNAYLLVTEGR